MAKAATAPVPVKVPHTWGRDPVVIEYFDSTPSIPVAPGQTTVFKSIAEKLSEVLGAIAMVPKLGKNTAQNYNFAREADLVDMIRPLLAARKLFLHQTVVSRTREPLYTSRQGSIMVLTLVDVAFTWIDGETGERSEPAIFPGDGADSGDKGIYKALTGAEKYFLMKTFLVSTGDDPEGDERVDKAAAAAEAAGGARTVSTRQPRATAQTGTTRGGRSATATNPQLSEITRLARVLHLNISQLAAFIGKITGTVAANGPALTEYLRGLDAESVGKVVVAMTAASETDPVEDPTTDEAPAPEDDDVFGDQAPDDDAAGA